MKKHILTLLLLLTTTIYSMEMDFNAVTKGLTDQQREDLLKNGEITQYHTDMFTPELLLDAPLSKDLLNRHNSTESNIGSEILMLNSDPAVIGSTLDYYKALLSVESLEGITYYSESKERDRVLFEESWFIDNLDDKTKLTQPQTDSVETEVKYLIHQKDTTFGDSESQVSYYSRDSVLNMHLINKTPLKLSIIKAVDKERLSIDLLVVPTDMGVLCYGLISSKTIKLSIVEKRAAKSFYNRIVAINRWFFDQVKVGK